MRRRRFLTEIGNHAALIAVSIMFLLPMAFIVLTALMTDSQAKTPDFWPHPFQWSNFLDVFDRIPLLRYTLNTVTISTLATVGVVLSCIPVALGQPYVSAAFVLVREPPLMSIIAQ